MSGKDDDWVDPYCAISGYEEARRELADIDLLRAIDCIAALDGIADPAAFVRRAKAMEYMVRRCWECQGAMNSIESRPDEIARLAAEWTEDTTS